MHQIIWKHFQKLRLSYLNFEMKVFLWPCFKCNLQDLLLEKALAAALLADVGLQNEVSHIVSTLDGDAVQDDPSLAVRFEALLAWIGSK